MEFVPDEWVVVRTKSGRPSDYYINRKGQIYSKKKNRIVEPSIANSGYCTISINGKQMYLHRLIYSTFINMNIKGREIHHIDGNKLNNSVENLEPLTKEDHAKKGSLKRWSDPNKIISIAKDLEQTDLTPLEIANKHGVKRHVIYSIMNRKSYADITQNFDFSKRINSPINTVIGDHNVIKLRKLIKKGKKSKQELVNWLMSLGCDKYRASYLIREAKKHVKDQEIKTMNSRGDFTEYFKMVDGLIMAHNGNGLPAKEYLIKNTEFTEDQIDNLISRRFAHINSRYIQMREASKRMQR